MESFRNAHRLLLASLVLIACAGAAGAQATTGAISGTVTDVQGGAIPGATVFALSDSKGTRSTPIATTQQGTFVVPSLRADTYTVEVSMNGFRTTSRPNVVIKAGSRVSAGVFVLDVAPASELVLIGSETAHVLDPR